MAVLLMIPLLLALSQPIASQVNVNSSSYDGITRTPAPEEADQTQESLRRLTEVPDQMMGLRAKTDGVTDRNALFEDSVQGDTISNVQLEDINNTVEETSTKPSKTHMKVDLTAHSSNRTKGGPSQTQHPTVRPVTTILTQKTEGYSEKETTTFITIEQDSIGAKVAEAERMPEKTVTDTNKEGWSMSAVLLPTVVSLVHKSNDADQDQPSHIFLTTESTTHIKPTVGLMLQAKASTAIKTNKKPSTSVYSPVVADRMNTSEVDLEGE